MKFHSDSWSQVVSTATSSSVRQFFSILLNIPQFRWSEAITAKDVHPTCHKGPITAYQTHRTSPQANKWKKSALRHVDSTHVKRKAGPSMLREQEQSIT